MDKNKKAFIYIGLNKPFGYLSQFTVDHPGQKTLKDIIDVPQDVYPIGRLDKDSEGLLLLSNDRSITNQLLHPKRKHKRKYLAQVENIISMEALDSIKSGVIINANKKKYKTLPAEITRIEEPELWKRNPPVRFRKNIPTSWVEIVLSEGKNRQVRKMLASTGFPVLRLVRVQIENLILSSPLGAFDQYSKEEFYRKLKLN